MSGNQVSEAESRVMQALWRHSPRTAAALVAEVCGETDWGAATVKTLLGRLVGKGAVTRRKKAGLFEYVPAISGEEYAAAAADRLTERAFGASASAFVSFFVKRAGLSNVEIDKLQKLLAEVKADRYDRTT